MRWITAVILVFFVDLIAVVGFLFVTVDTGDRVTPPDEDERVPMKDIERYRIAKDVDIEEITRPDPSAPLDTNVTLINAINATGDNGTEPYGLFKIDNVLGTATRYQVHGRSGRLDPEQEARIMSIMAWRDVVNQTFDSENRNVLEQQGYTFNHTDASSFVLPISTTDSLARAIEHLGYREAVIETYRQSFRYGAYQTHNISQDVLTTVEPLRSATQPVINLSDRMNETETDEGQTVWEKTTAVHPVIEPTFTGIQNLDATLDDWDNAARNLNNSSYALYELFRLYEYQASLPLEKDVAGTFTAYREDFSRLQNETEDLNRSITRVDDTVLVVANISSQFPRFGPTATRLFEDIHSQFNESRHRIEQIDANLTRQQIIIDLIDEEYQAIADEYYSQFKQNSQSYVTWQQGAISDGGARSQVYRYLGLTVVLLITTIFLLYKTLAAVINLARWAGNGYYGGSGSSEDT